MSQQVIVTNVCDGSHPAESQADRTIPFAIDGKDYETDLCASHALGMAADLAPFIEHARPAGKAARTPKPARKRDRSRAERDRSAAVRAWAREQGIPVSDHGRMPAALLARYEAAQAAAQAGAVISARRR